MKKNKEIFEECVKQWGIKAQMGMVVEECAELIQAISKVNREKPGSVDNLLEELADVELMVEQMRYYFDGNKIDEWKKLKMERLKVKLGLNQ